MNSLLKFFDQFNEVVEHQRVPIFARSFGSAVIALSVCFLINNWLTYGLGLPGANRVFEAPSLASLLQLGLYGVSCVGVYLYLNRSITRDLKSESECVTALCNACIRAAFFAVLYVGIVDFVLSFLRAESLLVPLFGEEVAAALRLSSWRGLWIHMPLIGLGILTALRVKTLGFHWLTFLIVLAELTIVISRFVFSYEQSFMADLVRFWYAALFLFASAYTLIDEGHVRVDVLYAAMTRRQKGQVNAVGSVLLGMSFCGVILLVGFASATSIINGPLFNFEISQSGVGMHIKYLMAGFIGFFALIMLFQFVGYFYSGLSDWRGEGAEEPDTDTSVLAGG